MYALDSRGRLSSWKSHTAETLIYSFKTCEAYIACEDDNLDRLENGRIISY